MHLKEWGNKMQISREIIDQHIHSEFSPDSDSSLEDIVKHAISLDKAAVVTTDHFEYDCKYFKQDVLIDMDRYHNQIQLLSQKYPIDIRKGIEVGYRKDYKLEINRYLMNHSFDVVLLSAHNDGVLDFSESLYHAYPLHYVLRHYFEHVRDAVDQMNNYDIVTHLDYVVRYSKHIITEDDYLACSDVISDIIQLMIEKNKVLELNTTGLYRQGWIHPHPFILKLYVTMGGTLVSLGSDAHQISKIEQGFNEALQLLQTVNIREIVQFKNRQAYTVSID